VIIAHIAHFRIYFIL